MTYLDNVLYPPCASNFAVIQFSRVTRKGFKVKSSDKVSVALDDAFRFFEGMGIVMLLFYPSLSRRTRFGFLHLSMPHFHSILARRTLYPLSLRITVVFHSTEAMTAVLPRMKLVK